MVGAAILRQLHARGADTITIARADLDLTDQGAVRAFFARHRPGGVILAAARVGGIHANTTMPASFIAENLQIQTNVITAAHAAGVQRLLFLGSSCIYPRAAAQPMPEEALLTGPLEPTNEPYAIAKIAGLKLCESYNRQYGTDYRAVMPTNLYGPGDMFHPQHSHVLPALMQRFHDATLSGAAEVTIWGSGQPLREFLHVDDMANGALFVMDLPHAAYARETAPMRGHLNLGSGQEVSIADLARMMAQVTGFAGRIVFDPERPDGAPRKLMDGTRLARLGWRARISLRDGLAQTYGWYCDRLRSAGPDAALRGSDWKESTR
jgi:nucleoside-diphosphate-sugar epimerase